MNVQRYHPALVALHWISGLLVIAALVFGTFLLQEIPNTSPEKIDALRGQMTIGIIILALTILRLIIKMSTDKPTRGDRPRFIRDDRSMH